MPDAATGPHVAEQVDVVLRDGSTVHVRPLGHSDAAPMETFLGGLSEDSLRLRYFTGAANLSRASRESVAMEPPDAYGLVATRGDGRIVAHACYVGDGATRAEVAFAVADDLQGQGIATTLLAHLAEAASECGVDWFVAEVLPENHSMIEVFRDSGFEVQTKSSAGVIEVEFPTALTPLARERFEARQRVGSVAAVSSFLAPRSVAVIGASSRAGSVGNQVVRNLLESDFNGPVYAVNPRPGTIESLPAYASIEDVPDPVELAVIAVPAAAVVEVARACGRRGVRALLVLSAGFAEVGEEGARRQRELVGICRDAGMRLVGPNCIGVVNTDPQVRLDATFARATPPVGGVGFLSQSGALGLAIMEGAAELGLGLSSFVSNGNKADISGNDLLEYWESDARTDLIVLYLESFGNPRKFSRLARRVGQAKPVLAVKSGRSSAGSRATSSHTGALVSASDVTVGALFRQAGVIRTDTLSELFNVARLLSAQPVPRGRRVGIVTNGGGLGILCADACEAAGLDVSELPERVRDDLAQFLPPAAATANPVDMIATATAEHYGRAVATLAASGAVDAVIALFIPPLATRAEDVARAVAAAAVTTQLPVLAVFAAQEPPAAALEHAGERIPAYGFPEDAAHALGRAAEYGTWRERKEEPPPGYADLRKDEATAVIAAALGDGSGWLSPVDVARVLDCYGVKVPAWRLAATPEEAAHAATLLGGPVAVKSVATGLVHKTDVGAVELGAEGAGEVRSAAERVRSAVRSAGFQGDGFLVQRMAPPGVEMLVGVVHDPLFGPLVACGAGGTTAELLGDASVRLTPVTRGDAREMVRSLRTYPLLRGYRGAEPLSVSALEEVVTRLSALVEDHPEIAEADLNPVLVGRDDATVVDARIRVEQAPPRRPWPSVGA
jgi:acetyl coenzyme A synthetase (ADP forming)-like protein